MRLPTAKAAKCLAHRGHKKPRRDYGGLGIPGGRGRNRGRAMEQRGSKRGGGGVNLAMDTGDGTTTTLLYHDVGFLARSFGRPLSFPRRTIH